MHPSETVIEAGDYNGYRTLTRSGDERFFLALGPGDWLDVTDQIGNFRVFELKGDSSK
jgi:hypothetical protein